MFFKLLHFFFFSFLFILQVRITIERREMRCISLNNILILWLNFTMIVRTDSDQSSCLILLQWSQQQVKQQRRGGKQQRTTSDTQLISPPPPSKEDAMQEPKEADEKTEVGHHRMTP
jgi:hypothetical protein